MEEKQSGSVFNLAQAINPVYAHEGNKGDNELVIKAQVSLLESLIELQNDFSWLSRLGKSAEGRWQEKKKNHAHVVSFSIPPQRHGFRFEQTL